jgi:hypothetical protein
VQYFNECEKDRISGDLITWGNYYYEDDEDGFIIGLDHYYTLKKKYVEDTFDYSKLEQAKSEKAYKNELLKAERNLFTHTLFSRQIAGKEPSNGQY